MTDKWMNIPNDDTQNNSFCRIKLWLERLDTQLNEPANQNLMKVPKVVKPANKKTLLCNFGD